MFRQLTATALATVALAACEPTAPVSNDPYSTIPTGDYVLFNIGGEGQAGLGGLGVAIVCLFRTPSWHNFSLSTPTARKSGW